MLNPPLKLICHSAGGAFPFAVHFQDGETKCHIWSKGPGHFASYVHRNTPLGQTWRGDPEYRHGTSDLDAKKYAKIRERLAQISHAAFDLARKEFERAEAEKEARTGAEQHQRDLETLHRLADRLGFDLVARA